MKRRKMIGVIALALMAMFVFVACAAPAAQEPAAEESVEEEAVVDEAEEAAADEPAADESEADKPAANSADAGSLQEILGITDEQIALLDGQEFNLRMLLAMTGNGDYYGRAMSAGAELAVEQINEMTGMNMKLSIEDHQSGDITAGSNGARSLINKDNVSAILSSFGNITSAIAPQIQQSETLTFNPGGANDEQLGIDYLWMGRMLFGVDPMPGNVDFVVEEFPEAKKAALIMNAENATSVYEDMLPDMWPEKSGGEIVLLETANVGVTDFNQIVTKAKASGADVIFTTVVNNDLGYLLKQLREANVEIPVVGVEITDQQIELAGEAGLKDYYFGQDYFDVNSENPFAQQFIEAYREKNGSDPDFYAANYYQNVFVIMDCIIDVLEKGGDITSGTELQESLVEINNFPTVYGGEDGTLAYMSYTLEDHSCNLPMGIYTIEEGQPVFIKNIEKVPVSSWKK